MLQRFVVGYAIFTAWVAFISVGMMVQGTAHPGNPAWAFVSTVRNFCFLSWLVAGVVAALAHELSKPDPAKTVIDGPTEEEIAEATERNRVERERQEKDRSLREERERKEAERRAKEEAAARSRQEELRRQAEEKRKKRSAEEAVTSGLDDFL